MVEREDGCFAQRVSVRYVGNINITQWITTQYKTLQIYVDNISKSTVNTVVIGFCGSCSIPETWQRARVLI